LGNLRWKEILKDQGIDISFFKLFRIYLGGYSIMYLFPSILLAGEFFRMYGLGKERGLSWKGTASSVINERVLEWPPNLLVVFLDCSFLFLRLISFRKKSFYFLGSVLFSFSLQ
jgi:uncharacterized protein (TIRG00374 family)